MEYEEQSHSWMTGFYWTLTVMSTLGFGDITFQSDLGRGFSIFVLVTGIIFLLVLLPFTFIQFFYSPWIEAQNKARAPQQLPHYTKDHVIFTEFDDITKTLIEKFNNFGINYIIILDDLNKSLELYDLGYKAGYGDIDDPRTYSNMRVEQARLLFASNTDEINSNITFTVRELTEETLIVTTADSVDSIDILQLAGSNLVIEPRKMIGSAIARRTLGGNALASLIGEFESLLIAEAPAMGTPMIGKTLNDLDLRKKVGINIAGFWDKGHFVLPDPNYVINDSTVLLLVGTQESIDLYNEIFVIFHTNTNPVIIIGAGRVAKFVVNDLKKREIDYVIVEKDESSIRKDDFEIYKNKLIIGNAADIHTLKSAGIDTAPSVIISTSDDDMNIYLTLYCRRLRPDIQIISRANSDKNVSTLVRAGSNLIMSYPSLTANAVFNFMERSKILMLSEGIDIFSVSLPAKLRGKNLTNSNIREKTGCNVIALKKNGNVIANPDPREDFAEDTTIILLGTEKEEKKFMMMYF